MNSSSPWLDNLVRPILVSVLSGVLLFFLALLFKPLIYDLLTPPGVPQYPLVCYAEPYPGETPEQRRVDFFIINLDGKRYRHADLEGVLKNFGPSDRRLTPDIRLTMKDSERGTLSSVRMDTPFNRQKGDIRAEIGADRRSVEFYIDWIEERALIRIDLTFTGMRDTGVTVRRMAKILVPFEFRRLQDGCFQG